MTTLEPETRPYWLAHLDPAAADDCGEGTDRRRGLLVGIADELHTDRSVLVFLAGMLTAVLILVGGSLLYAVALPVMAGGAR